MRLDIKPEDMNYDYDVTPEEEAKMMQEVRDYLEKHAKKQQNHIRDSICKNDEEREWFDSKVQFCTVFPPKRKKKKEVEKV